MRMRLSEVAEVFGSRWYGENLITTGVSTDSRSTENGDLFVALVGEHFDGHDFLSAAKARGAVAALISEQFSEQYLQQPSDTVSKIATIKTADTTKGLGLLAHHWHQQCAAKTIAITGSVGKTTVKEMLAAMLSKNLEICVTSGNYNNHIGLPLTLFEESKDDQVAVIEMGANARGEIAQLCKIATPQIGIITKIAEAHLSGFGSIAGVAEAKSELFDSLPDSGTAIINLDGLQLDVLQQASSHCQQIKVSLNKKPQSNFWAEQIETLGNGWKFECHSVEKHFSVELNLSGKHNIINALLAIAGVDALGFEAQQLSSELAQLRTVPGRLELCNLPLQGKLFDDSYNANPSSVKAAIDMLSDLTGNNILVLGDMGELGENEIQLHRHCGEYARDKNINKLFGIGNLASHAVKAFGKNAQIFANKEQLVEKLLSEISVTTNIVVKGSRAAKMEQVVEKILEKLMRDLSQKRNLLSLKDNNKQEQI